jgi:outer membrane protein OmpA-like peptidoglycan-associated protein
MKKIVQFITLFLFVACLSETQAQSKNDFKFNDYNGVIMINNSRLEEEGNEIRVVIEVQINGRGVQNYAAVRLVPKIVGENNYRLLPDIMILGNNKRKTYNRWLRTMSKVERFELLDPETIVYVTSETDTTFIYDTRLSYEPWMDKATLALNQELIDYRDQRSLMVFALGGKVVPEYKEPYKVQPKVNFITPEPEQRNRRRQGKAFLDFHSGSSEIVLNYRRNFEELAKINQTFSEIASNPDVKINGLYIEGYASPEGHYAANVRLSKERTIALKNYILNKFRLPVSYGKVHTASFVESWGALHENINTSDIPYKERVLSIIDNTPHLALCEAKLRRLSGVWPTLQRDFLPLLRRVEYQIDFTVKDYSLNEARMMLRRGTILLSQLELFCVAMSYGESSSEFENIILEVIPTQYSNDPVAAINAAALMLRKGETSAAKYHLEKHADNPAAWNNLGVIHLQTGDLDKAQLLFERAAAQGITEATHNLQEVASKRADNAKIKKYKITN